MRKLFALFLLSFVFCVSAHAQGQRVYQTTTATADVALNNVGSGISYHLLTWNDVGSVPTCQIKLEQAPASTGPWTDLIAAQACTSNGQSLVTNVTANFVRINPTTKTGVGTLTVRWNGYVVNPGGTATTPSGAANTIQYNNANAFGGVTGLTNGLAADCDGMGDPCTLLVTDATGNFTILRKLTDGPAGNYSSLAASASMGAVTNQIDAYDGTHYAVISVNSATGGLADPSMTSQEFIYPKLAGVLTCPVNSICVRAPSGLLAARDVQLPASTAQGTLTNVLQSGVVQQGYSGETNRAASVVIGSGASIGSAALCSTGDCPVGTYRVNVYLDITTACTISGTYVVNLNYTDDQGSKTVPVNINGTGSVPATGVLTTTSTANFGQASQIVRSTGGASINYSTTALACGGGGPMVGKLYLSVEPIQ